MVKGLGEMAGALMEMPRNLDWANAEFLGTVFPISEPERLYLGARHTLPDDGAPMGILIFRHGELIRTAVEEVGDFPGQPDVMVLRAAIGCRAATGLALGPALVWEEVRVVGYPEDAVVRDFTADTQFLGMRGLRGYVTRPLLPGHALKVNAPALEVSFGIPAGVSGGPCAVYRSETSFASGLVGVCIANASSTSLLWQQDELVSPGERTTIRSERVIEYGIVASLTDLGHEAIPMVGASLYELIGQGPGGARVSGSGEVTVMGHNWDSPPTQSG